MPRQKREGEQVVEINYEEVYNLVGRLLTLNDATNTDPVRRDALKTMIKREVYGWIEDVAYAQGMAEWGNRGGVPIDGIPEPTAVDAGPGISVGQIVKDRAAREAA